MEKMENNAELSSLLYSIMPMKGVTGVEFIRRVAFG